MTVHLAEYYGVFNAVVHHLVYQCALLAEPVAVAAHAHNDHLGMSLQTRRIFLYGHAVLQHEELLLSVYRRDERHGAVWEYGIYALRSTVCRAAEPCKGVEVHYIFKSFNPFRRHLLPHIDVVGHHVAALFAFSLRVYVLLYAVGVRDDHRYIVAADISYGARLAAFGVQIVELQSLAAGYHGVPCPACDILHEMLCYGDFSLRFLAQRHPYRVADAVGEQRSYAHGTLYASVLAFACLRHAQMQRIVHALLLHCVHEKAHRAHHDNRVACFY